MVVNSFVISRLSFVKHPVPAFLDALTGMTKGKGVYSQTLVYHFYMYDVSYRILTLGNPLLFFLLEVTHFIHIFFKY